MIFVSGSRAAEVDDRHKIIMTIRGKKKDKLSSNSNSDTKSKRSVEDYNEEVIPKKNRKMVTIEDSDSD